MALWFVSLKSFNFYLFKLARLLFTYSFVFKIVPQKLSVTEDFFYHGYFWINLKTFILKIIVFLRILKFATNLTNFFFAKPTKYFHWWYATVMMPFLFVQRIFSYSSMMLAACSRLSTFSALSFNSSVSILSLLTSESINSCLTSTLFSRFFFLTFSEPFHR